MKKYTQVIAVLGGLGALDVAYIDFVLGPALFSPSAATAQPEPAPLAAVLPAEPSVTEPPAPALPASDAPAVADRAEAEAPYEDQWVVRFPETGQIELSQSALQELRQLADRLASSHELRSRVIGHADERGDHANNWRLGAMRALAVAEQLQRAGFRPDQIDVTSKGEDAPVVPGSDSEAWAENRRAEIVVQARRSTKKP